MTCIALLRGVNLGAHNKVAMSDLRELGLQLHRHLFGGWWEVGSSRRRFSLLIVAMPAAYESGG